MKKQYTFFIILFALIFIFLILSYFKILNISSNSITIGDTNLYQALDNKKSSFEEKNISINNDFYEIDAKYPLDIFDKEKEIEKYVLYKVNQKEEEWKIGGDTYNAEKELDKRFPDRAKIKYTLYISYERHESKKHGTVSYVFTIYEFTGGAHGNNVVDTFTFNDKGRVYIENILNFTENNSEIDLSKIFADKLIKEKGELTNKNMVMQGLGLAYLKADGKTLDTAKCNCDGFLFNSNFQNFYIEDNGISFVFNQYQIAPGASGIITLNIDWNLLLPFIKDFDF